MTAADRPSVTDNARAEAERRYPNIQPRALADAYHEVFVAGAEWAAGRAETTTATVEDAVKVAARALLDTPGDMPGVHDIPGPEQWAEHMGSAIVKALDARGLLATARTRPTLSSIAGKLADEMGCERTRDASTGVNFCATHYVGWLSDTDQCARAERLADAVLALLNKEADR